MLRPKVRCHIQSQAMKTLLFGVVVSVSLATLQIACAPQKFGTDPNWNPCEEMSGQTCQYVAKDDQLEYSFNVKSGQVDILFIDDNSGSMYFEQSQMGSKFPQFLNRIQNLDYRIGITTTDVSASPNNPPRAINQFGDLQDGNLIEFSQNNFYLTPDTANKENLFLNTIKRQETLNCEQAGFAYASCPSFDERGVYAANMVLDKNPKGFIRKGAHLAIVVLSDEDERSRGFRTGDAIPSGFEEYLLQTYDLPQGFLGNLKKKYGVDKTLSVHAVVVRPGDQTCLNKQMNGTLRGFEGKTYVELADLADGKLDGQYLQGTVGDICASDYGIQMGDIGSKISDLTTPIQLACKPLTGTLSIRVDPVSIDYTVDDRNRVVFSQPVPKGSTITGSYRCEVLYD